MPSNQTNSCKTLDSLEENPTQVSYQLLLDRFLFVIFTIDFLSVLGP